MVANAATVGTVDADNIDDTMHTMQGVSTRPMQTNARTVWGGLEVWQVCGKIYESIRQSFAEFGHGILNGGLPVRVATRGDVPKVQ